MWPCGHVAGSGGGLLPVEQRVRVVGVHHLGHHPPPAAADPAAFPGRCAGRRRAAAPGVCGAAARPPTA